MSADYRPGGKAMVDLRLRGKLSSQDLDGYYRWLLEEGLSPATVAHHHAFLSQVLNQAVKWDWIGSPTAADKASPPALEQPDPDPPSVDDVRWLLNEFRTESEDLPALGFLAAQTGHTWLRWSRYSRPRGASRCRFPNPRMPDACRRVSCLPSPRNGKASTQRRT